MIRWVVMAACAAALGLSALDLSAQQRGGPSRADLALYAGGAWTSPWLETGEGTTFSIGFNPIFGTFGNFWVTNRLGARVHFGYMPSDLPQPNRPDAFGPTGPQEGAFDGRIHNFLYDLSLAFRPLASPGRTDALSTLYLFAGGGGFTANVTGGEAGQDCVPDYVWGGVCLPYDWQDATVVQFTGGAGLAMIPLTRRLGLFAEAGVHLYPSPFTTADVPPCPDPACNAEGRRAITTRLVGGLALAMGVPTPPPPPLPPPPPPPPPAPDEPIVICVVSDGIPQYVEAWVRPQQGDTVIVGAQGVRRPLRAVYPAPPPTASGRDWFVRDENIFLEGREYVRFGVPRELEADRIRRIGDYLGVPLFTPTGAASPPQTLYVPVQDGCIFQPYQLQERVRRVRG